MKTKTYPSFGTVSHGTMRTQDLISSFIGELEYHKVQTPYKGLSNLCRLSSNFDDDHSYWNSEDASYDLDVLFDRLNELCGPYQEFGSHQGDGSDYGFWFCWESFEDDCRYGEIEKVDELPAFEDVDDDASYVAVVSDHGNVELYSIVRDDQGNVTDLTHLYGIV